MTQPTISEQIVERETRYLARAQKIPYTPVAFERGWGALLYDYEGREYIDFLSSASSANVGHGNAEIARAAADQMARGFIIGATAVKTTPTPSSMTTIQSALRRVFAIRRPPRSQISATRQAAKSPPPTMWKTRI